MYLRQIKPFFNGIVNQIWANVHRMIKRITFFLLFLACVAPAFAQKSISADKVVAVVGDKAILESDIQKELINEGQENPEILKNPNARCILLSDLMTKKLLLIQAAIDSVTVEDAEVDNDMNSRFNIMMRNYYGGDQEKMESVLGKSLLEYKEEVRPEVYANKLSQKMRAKLVEKVSVSPADVTKFYNTSKDSIPLIGTEVVVAEIIKNPKASAKEKQAAREKLMDIREQIRAGKKFETMALLYSQDPGSSSKEGDLGFASRGTYAKEFEATAYRLKPGELSLPVETEFGYHLIQVVERRGNQIHARHILIIPEVSQADLDSAKTVLDSAYRQIKSKKITFGQGAVLYSDDDQSKGNAGMIYPTALPLEQLEQVIHTKPTIFSVVDTMKAGDLTPALAYSAAEGNKRGFRLVNLTSKTSPHKADLAQDYARIQTFAMQAKQSKVFFDWVERKKLVTYIKIDSDYLQCAGMKSWIKKTNRL